MSLDELRHDVVTSIGYTLTPVFIEVGHGLTNTLPARVTPRGDQYCIEILNTLSPIEKIEAEAHELAHILLEYQGLIALDPNAISPCDPWEWIYLSIEITQAISHRFVVDLLISQYGISSDFHLRLREVNVNSIPIEDADSENHIAQLHGFGVYLYDLEKTVYNILSRIEEVSCHHEAISHSLSMSRRYLNDITLDMCRDEQLIIINKFLSELGYDPRRFPPLPPRINAFRPSYDSI
ncbi:MAG: hypothetical protein ACYC0V_07560 [Armatimonadota bacterium]